MSALDEVIEFVKVLASEVLQPNSAVTMNVAGSVGGFTVDGSGNPTGADLTDVSSDSANQQPAWQSLGVLGRPLPPDASQFFLEALAVRRNDGLEPFAYRDLRINRAVNPTGGSAPAAGQTIFAGYGGGFLSHQQTAANVGSQKGTITTLYLPYAFNGSGVPTKAHAIILDPTTGASSIQLIHGDGIFFQLTEDTGAGPGIVASINGATFLRMSAGALTVQAAKIMLKGNVYVGAEAEAGLPLLAGAASPPCPSLFVSPL